MNATDETPITLDDACAYFGGKITKSTLKAEAKKGRLRVQRLGRRYFTTMADVKAMYQSLPTVSPSPPIANTPAETDALTAKAALLARLGSR